MAKHRRYSRKRIQKGGLINTDKQTLRDLGFTENDINYIFGRHKNMQIEFFINSVNGIPGNEFYPHPQTPQEIMERLRDEGDYTDEDTDNSDMDGGKRRYKRRTTNKRKTKKSKKTRKHRKRRQRGGDGFTTSLSMPLEENKNNYDTYVRLGLREY
jgi:hypothetical protein